MSRAERRPAPGPGDDPPGLGEDRLYLLPTPRAIRRPWLPGSGALVIELQSQADISASARLEDELIALRVATAAVEARIARPVHALLQLTPSEVDGPVVLGQAERRLEEPGAMERLVDSVSRIHPDRARDPRDNFGAALAEVPARTCIEKTVRFTRTVSTRRDSSVEPEADHWIRVADPTTTAALTRTAVGRRTTVGELFELNVKSSTGMGAVIGASVSPIHFGSAAGTPDTDRLDFLLFALLAACESSLS